MLEVEVARGELGATPYSAGALEVMRAQIARRHERAPVDLPMGLRWPYRD